MATITADNRDPGLIDRNVWVEMIVNYLKVFQSFHPYKSTVRIIISEGWLAKIYHYHPGPYYYCGVYEHTEMRPVWCGIIAL